MFLFYKLNNFGGVFPICFVLGIFYSFSCWVRVYLLLWLGCFNNFYGWSCSNNLFSLHSWLSSLFYYNLWVFFNVALDRNFIRGRLLNAELLHVKCFFVFGWYFCSWNAWMDVFEPVSQNGLFLAINQRYTNTHIHFYTLLICRVK